MRRARAQKSFPAAVLATLWLFAPILGLVHGLGETHEYCAEHGAFEERSGPQGAPAPSSAVVIPDDASAGDEHTSCPFSPAAGGAATVGEQRPLALRAPTLPPLALPEAATPPPAPVPLLSLAPKASPPSLA